MPPKVDLKTVAERLDRAEGTLASVEKIAKKVDGLCDTHESNFSAMGEFNNWLKESQTTAALVTGCKPQMEAIGKCGASG